jgi:flagellin-like protein
MEKKGVSPVVGTILLIAITVALAAIVAMLVSGLGGRGAPPSAMLAVTARDNGDTIPATEHNVVLTISHNGGDDLIIADLQIQASDKDGTMITILSDNISRITGVLSVGNTLTAAYHYDDDSAGKAITVYIIHVPSKQKLFSSETIIVT